MAIGLRKCYISWDAVSASTFSDVRTTVIWPGDNQARILTQLQNLSEARINYTWADIAVAPAAVPTVLAGYESVTWVCRVTYLSGIQGQPNDAVVIPVPAPASSSMFAGGTEWLASLAGVNAPMDAQVYNHAISLGGLIPDASLPGRGIVEHRWSDTAPYRALAANFMVSTIWHDRLGRSCSTHWLQIDNSLALLTEVQHRSLAFADEVVTGSVLFSGQAPPAGATFTSIWDTAELRFRTNRGSQAVINIPAPEQVLFDASSEKVFSGVATPLISEVVGHAFAGDGSLITDYLGGRRYMDRRY